MMWLKTVSDDEAQGYAKEVFDQYRSRNGSVPNLHRVLATRPEILKGRETLRNGTTGGATTLGRHREELLNFFGATAGGCTGWVMNHGALLRQISGLEKQDVVQIGKDYKGSVLTEQDKVMLAFAEKINDAPHLLCLTDIEQLRQAGFNDENILDIIASVAYRNFSNRLNIAIGLDDPENLSKLDPDFKAMLDAKVL